MGKLRMPANAIRPKRARHNVRARQARAEGLTRPAKNALDAVVETIADDVNRHGARRADVEQGRKAGIHLNPIEELIDLLMSGGHEINLIRQALPGSDPPGDPLLFDLQPATIGELFEHDVGCISTRNGAVEVEKHDRWWCRHR